MASESRAKLLGIAKACFLIIYLKLSFRGREVILPFSRLAQTAGGERHHETLTTTDERPAYEPPSVTGSVEVMPTQSSTVSTLSFPENGENPPSTLPNQALSQANMSLLAPQLDRGPSVRTRTPVRVIQLDPENYTRTHVGNNFDHVTISGNASAQLGDIYSTYNVTNTHLYSQYDTYRVGMVAGTTAAMMSQILSAALTYLKHWRTGDHGTLNPHKTPHFLMQVAEQIAFAVADSWIDEYVDNHRASSHDGKLMEHRPRDKRHGNAEADLLSTLVPIIGVEKNKRYDIWESEPCAPLEEVFTHITESCSATRILGDLKDLQEQEPYKGRNPTLLRTLSSSGLCIVATMPLQPTKQCPIVHDFARNKDVCCLVLRDDHFAPQNSRSRAALIVFKSKELATAAMQKYRDIKFESESESESQDGEVPVGVGRATFRVGTGSSTGLVRRSVHLYRLEWPLSITERGKFRGIFFDDGKVKAVFSHQSSLRRSARQRVENAGLASPSLETSGRASA